MKRTTYIFIGILVSVLVILMAGVVYISFQKSETNSYTLTLSEKILRTEFSGIRAVKVYANDTRRVWLDEACVNVVSSTDGKTRLLSPESEYLKISQNADTLVICLDLTTYDLPKQKKEYLIPALQAKGLQLTIEADSNLAFVANAIRGLRTRIDRLHADSLTTYIRGGELRLDSCEIRAFCVDGDGVTFNAHQSIIPHLYLDLDGVRNWGVHESVIGTDTGTCYLYNADGDYSCLFMGGDTVQTLRCMWRNYRFTYFFFFFLSYASSCFHCGLCVLVAGLWDRRYNS